jgi:hypothetical protein
MTGSCQFAVDGVVVGSLASYTLEVPPGEHTVACKMANGTVLTNEVFVVSDQTVDAVF